MEQIVEIFAFYRAEADAKLAKLAKRAARYGQVVAWAVEPFELVRKRARWDGKDEERVIPMLRYRVEGEAPRAGAYRFVAELEREPGGVLIHGEEVGAMGREWAGECQHCHAKRARRLGYVVEDDAGDRKIVGRACLRDHLGMDAPAGALWAFQFLKDVAAMGDEESGWGGGGRWEQDVRGVLAVARAVIALYGWEPGGASAHNVSSALAYWPLKGDALDVKKAVRAELAVRGQHYADAADAVLAWVRAMDAKNDYQHNLKVACAGDVVDMKRVGLIASAAAYDNQVAVEVKRAEEAKAKAKAMAALPDPIHIGAVGDRLMADVVLERRIALPDGDFGPRAIWIMRADNGAVLKWFSGALLKHKSGKPVEIGDRFLAKFSVKAHGSFRDVPENVVARVAVQ